MSTFPRNGMTERSLPAQIACIAGTAHWAQRTGRIENRRSDRSHEAMDGIVAQAAAVLGVGERWAINEDYSVGHTLKARGGVLYAVLAGHLGTTWSQNSPSRRRNQPHRFAFRKT